MSSRILPPWDDRLDAIPRLEAVAQTTLFGLRAREPIRVHQAHVARLSANGGDEQGHDQVETKMVRGTCPHACSINPMRFGQLLPHTIGVSSATGATLHRQSERLETLVECPSCGVDCCRITQRGFRLQQDTLEPLRLLLEKVLYQQRSFLVIAGLTSQGQVIHS